MPNGEAAAVVDRRGPVTRRELSAAVRRFRAGLVAHGVREGDAVVVVTANERESVVAYRAVVELGAVAVLTQGSAGSSELDVAVATTAPRLVVVSPGATEVIGDPGFAAVAAAEVDAEPDGTTIRTDPDAPRAVVFTSGTTSTPKGVVHSARTLAAAVACFLAMTGLGADDRLFLVSPLASITGVLQALELAPAVGAAAVLESAFDDDGTLDLMTTAGATFYGGPDLVLDRLLTAAARRDLGVPLRLAALGGTMLRRELVETAEQGFGIRVVRVYGSSEAPCSTGTRPDEPASVRLVDEGAPGPGVELRLDDSSGELLVRGPHVFCGYLDQGETEAALVDGWFRTGDVAELVEGRLRIVGRLKEVVSRNGRKISLAEVEHAFAAASGITECAAFAVPDDRTGERVAVAVHVEGAGRARRPNRARRHGGGRSARWKLPESVFGFDEPLPTTASGKVQRRHLAERGKVLWRAARLAPANH